MFFDPTKKFPGPGSYNATNATDNKLGFCMSSKFRSPGGPVISRSGKRFDHRDQRRSMEIPGPGAYIPNYKQRQRNFGVAVIGSEKRLNTASVRRGTPGPGTYRVQSDFGFYDVADTSMIGLSVSKTMH